MTPQQDNQRDSNSMIDNRTRTQPTREPAIVTSAQDLKSQIDPAELADIMELGVIHVTIGYSDGSHEIKLGYTDPQTFGSLFWDTHPDPLPVVEEMVELITLPDYGLSVNWPIAHRDEAGDLRAPIIPEIRRAMTSRCQDQLSRLETAILNHLDLRPTTVFYG